MTTVRVHELTGFRPDALASYLGGLGVLRLLAEQHDPDVRGFWRDEHFVLVTKLEWDEIEEFFVKDYAPTPILAPWNQESGFFSLRPDRARSEEVPATGAPEEGGDTGVLADDRLSIDEEPEEEAEAKTDEAVGDPLLDHFVASKARRFASLREAIELARAVISPDLRRAEEDVRLVHEEVRQRTAQERAALDKWCLLVKEAEEAVAEREGRVKGKRRAADPQATEHDLREAREHEKSARKERKKCEVALREAERRAASNPEFKVRIAEAKKRFKEVQSSTKERLIADLRARWGSTGQQWVDAAVALDEGGEVAFTSIFGSGGNDGRMEFTKNFRHHLDALFDVVSGTPREQSSSKLRAALFGGPTNYLSRKAVGQFFPGRAGGTNMGAGFEGGAGINSWEFVLMLEGAVALVAGMSRRGEVGRARVSSPFWVEAAAAGFASASEREESPRGEQWLPLWSQPVRFGELVELIREGRAQVGRLQTSRAGDLVRATARLGLARGIDSLQRFAYLKRNGQANLAVFTGRFHVRCRSHQALLDEVAPWIDRLAWHARPSKQNNVPASLGRIARKAQDALFSVCRGETTGRDWRALLVAVGEAELALLRSGKRLTRRPLPRLSSGWITAMDDGTAQGRRVLRLAMAFASQYRPIESESGEVRLTDSIRRHFIPLDEGDATRARFRLDERGRPEPDLDQVCVGRNLVADAIALVQRRSVWARTSRSERKRTPRLPLQAVRHCEATLEEVGAWVRGEVSDVEVLALVRPLLALDWLEIRTEDALAWPRMGGVIEPLHVLFRLAHLPFDVPVADADGRTEVAVRVRLDPEPLRRLVAGDVGSALKVAVRRLEASGLRPVFGRVVATPHFARRLAASLAFPVSHQDAARAARLVCKPYAERDVEDQPALPA